MSAILDQINLADLPPQAIVETVDAAALRDAWIADLVALYPEIADAIALESEPTRKQAEVAALREAALRQRLNDAAQAMSLAHAVGADLDHLGVTYHRTARLLITPADAQAIPPVAAVWETDAAYRARCQLAPEAYTAAGTVGSYTYHALSVDPIDGEYVAGISCVLPADDDRVMITVRGSVGDGTPSAELLAAVTARLTDDYVRPLGATIEVQAAEVVAYTVTASLELEDGAGADLVLAAAQADLAAYVADARRLGQEAAPSQYITRVARSGLDAALHQPGVRRVTLTGWTDIAPTPYQSAYCTGYEVTIA
ncbi:MAG: baseplate J/gp47 family protein [Myxococcales bacterium]|nr:baseplate J/gp47 family protein [Myxococcales bacterium]